MLLQLQCVVVDGDASNRQEMANFLANHGAHTVAMVPGVEQVPPVLGQPEPPQLVVVNLDPQPYETLKKVGVLVRQFPQVSFFVMSQVVDPHLLMEAMHLGVKEFVPLPVDAAKFAAGLDRIASQYNISKRARVIHFIPTMGGCGSTTIACNVAACLARSGKTVIVDLDLVRGAVAASFDIRPRYTIADVMDSAERLDGQLLDNALAVHPPTGLAVLARPELPEDSQRISHGGLSRLLGILSRLYDYVVIDSLMSFSPVYAAAIGAADLNVLVMQLNVPSARNTERFVGALRRMGVDSAKTRIVVNRFVKKGWDIAPEEVERSLGLRIAWLVPNDFKNAIAAINYGEPVVLRTPRAEISTSIAELAATLLQKRPAVAA